MQKWILEGAKIKYFGRLNTSLEGAELFGPPKIRAQLRLCSVSYGKLDSQSNLLSLNTYVHRVLCESLYIGLTEYSVCPFFHGSQSTL